MLDSVLILSKTYKKLDVYAQATTFSPIPTKLITPTSIQAPSDSPTPMPKATPTLTSTPIPPTNTPTSSPTVGPTSTSTNSVTPTTAAQSVQTSHSFDLTNWKLTLPIGESKNPKEILQPELASYSLDPWFIASLGELRFRAAVNGVTTGGSKYPRSELREMTDNGKNRASWSSKSGKHTMFLDQAISAIPQVKRHVVAGQIHDDDNDVIVIRLDYPVLYVNVDGDNEYVLDSDYTLGKRFSVKFEVSEGQTKIYYNGSAEPVYTLSKEYSGGYFKAGAYTQSNCSKEESAPCSESNFGEVIIYQLSVSHQ